MKAACEGLLGGSFGTDEPRGLRLNPDRASLTVPVAPQGSCRLPRVWEGSVGPCSSGDPRCAHGRGCPRTTPFCARMAVFCSVKTLRPCPNQPPNYCVIKACLVEIFSVRWDVYGTKVVIYFLKGLLPNILSETPEIWEIYYFLIQCIQQIYSVVGRCTDSNTPYVSRGNPWVYTLLNRQWGTSMNMTEFADNRTFQIKVDMFSPTLGANFFLKKNK